MPPIVITLHNGSEVPLQLPAPGNRKSCFFVGVQKGGSTLLTGIGRALAAQAGLSFYSLQAELRSMGFKYEDLTPDVQKAFVEIGYCYGGFRGIIDPLELPSFASGRTIFLARDPRDMVTSLYFSEAISHKPPGSSLSEERKKNFDARRERVREMQIDDFVIMRAANVAHSYETALSKLSCIDYKMYRYEDIVFTKMDWITSIAHYLGIEIAPHAIEAIAQRADIIPIQEDAASHIRKVTPGDHKEKLRPETISILNQTFDRILTKFDYT